MTGYDSASSSTTTKTTYELRFVEPKNALFPRVEIPPTEQLSIDEHRVSFVIETTHGPLSCVAYWDGIDCRGTLSALTEAGLYHPEWAPGAHGNNKTRQTVIFTEQGPALAIGRYTRSNSNRRDSVTVILAGKRISVYLAYTPEQEKRIDALCETEREKSYEAATEKKKAEAAAYKESLNPKTIAEWKERELKILEIIEFGLLKYTNLEGRFKFNAISLMKISDRLKELRAAIEGAVVVDKAPEPIHDNVLSFRQKVLVKTNDIRL